MPILCMFTDPDQYPFNRVGLRKERNDRQFAAASRTNQGQDFVDPGDQHRPKGCRIGGLPGFSFRQVFSRHRHWFGFRDVSIQGQTGVGRHHRS
ncbi:MAG: hypothetical protein ACRERU_13485 [Methylococcales bacterium]